MINHPILEDLRRVIRHDDLSKIPYDSLARVNILHEIDKLPAVLYDSLADGTIDWFEKSVAAMNEGNLPIDLPGISPTEAMIRKGRAKAVKSREKNQKIHKKSANIRIKEILLEQGLYTQPQKIKKIMEEEKWFCSIHLIKAVTSEFRRTLTFLSEKGLLTSRPKGLK